MAVHIRHFDRNKALEIIIFIAKKLKEPTLHSISKMTYLADKLHLDQYGRMMCGDKYIAMEYGPVPSAIYDMMKVADKRKSIDIDWDEKIAEAIEVLKGRYVIPKREYDKNLLSDSEIECISETISNYGDKSFGELTDITHDSAWKSCDQNETISLNAIVNSLQNASSVSDYLYSK
jgi:uncharacterized phage-associated protein